MASMALMPVCIGSLTGCRWTTDGAWTSRARSWVPAIAPRPSSGSPSGLTTRPRNPSPTGTERISPVRLTRWPSSMPENSPRITTPISRTSRLSAMPRVPFSNSSSSFAMAEGRPSTRAMPSPHSTTVPTSSRATPVGSYSSTNRASASRISSGRIVSSAIFLIPFVKYKSRFYGGTLGSAREFPADCGKTAGRGPVNQLITDLDGHTADDRRIVYHIQVNSLAVRFDKRRREPLPLRGRQLGGDPHHRDELLAAVRCDAGRQVEHRLRGAAARVGERLRDQAQGWPAYLLRQQVRQQVRLRRGPGGPDQRAAQPRLPGDHPAEPEQVVLKVV